MIDQVAEYVPRTPIAVIGNQAELVANKLIDSGYDATFMDAHGTVITETLCEIAQERFSAGAVGDSTQCKPFYLCPPLVTVKNAS